LPLLAGSVFARKGSPHHAGSKMEHRQNENRWCLSAQQFCSCFLETMALPMHSKSNGIRSWGDCNRSSRIKKGDPHSNSINNPRNARRHVKPLQPDSSPDRKLLTLWLVNSTRFTKPYIAAPVLKLPGTALHTAVITVSPSCALRENAVRNFAYPPMLALSKRACELSSAGGQL
jgi:hypothetical protein